jgi:DNA (cytosine-5)-methyltransferase 1
MRYLSLFSGIEAATVAWKPLGWKPLGFAEIAKFPSAVLKYHYPDVPNFGNVENFKEWPDLGTVDVVVGGSPCQSFSVAGLRKGMDDPRGNLALVYLGVANRYRPKWIVYENVPGLLSSNKGRDFGSFLGAMGELGYGWAYRVLDTQYVRVDGFGRAIPQRRRRVFVVGYLGDWRRAAAVLFDRESLLGNSPPRREAGQGTSHDVVPSLTASGVGVRRAGDIRGQDPVVAMATGQAGAEITTHGEDPTLTCNHEAPIVAHALRGEGFDASEDGTGRGTPIVPVMQPYNVTPSNSNKDYNARPAEHAQALTTGGGAPSARGGDIIVSPVAYAIQERAVSENPDSGPDGKGFSATVAAYTLEARSSVQAVAFDCKAGANTGFAIGDIPGALRGDGHGGGHAAIAFSSKDYGADADEGVAPTLRAMNHSDSHANGGGQVAVATQWAVRRLIPLECERLQGFEDNYTRIPEKTFPSKPRGLHFLRYPDLYDENPDGTWTRFAADGPRYKSIGNSHSGNLMRWLGRRIDMVEALS